MVSSTIVLARRARVKASAYVRLVAPLRIGTTYESTMVQITAAGISSGLQKYYPNGQMGIQFSFDNRWQHRLYLAPPTGLVGNLVFENGRLASKSTILGEDMCCVAAVYESESNPISKTSVVRDYSGDLQKIIVHLSARDFTVYRTQAYEFNLTCIGALRGCKPTELLATVKNLEEAPSK